LNNATRNEHTGSSIANSTALELLGIRHDSSDSGSRLVRSRPASKPFLAPAKTCCTGQLQPSVVLYKLANFARKLSRKALDPPSRRLLEEHRWSSCRRKQAPTLFYTIAATARSALPPSLAGRRCWAVRALAAEGLCVVGRCVAAFFVCVCVFVKRLSCDILQGRGRGQGSSPFPSAVRCCKPRQPPLREQEPSHHTTHPITRSHVVSARLPSCEPSGNLAAVEVVGGCVAFKPSRPAWLWLRLRLWLWLRLRLWLWLFSRLGGEKPETVPMS
jgi:hypothetical protein